MRGALLALVIGFGAACGACALTKTQTEAHSMEEWQHHAVVRVAERAGVEARGFPVSFELEAARLAAEGKMRPDGGDLRLTVAGRETPFQLEALDAERMRVTFQVNLAAGETRHDIMLHYGNPSAEPPQYDTDWGSIDPANDGFENELLRVSYGLKTGTFGQVWGCQTEFTIKAHDEDQFGGDAIPGSWAKSRNDVTYWEPDTDVGPTFEVEADGPIYKRVRFFAEEKIIQHHPGAEKIPVRDLSQRVTFYRNCPFIKEEFENLRCGATITAVPGGMRLRTPEGKRNFDFVAHNFDPALITWQGRGEDRETRGGWTADKARADKDPRYRHVGDYLYHDFLILGVVNVHNGRGIGTCANNLQTAFFVDWSHERAGYSLWQKADGRMTDYLYYVENGPGEVIARGKLLANPPAVTVVETSVYNEPNRWQTIAGGSADWGQVRTGTDANGQWGVVLENSRIRVHYRCGVTDEDLQTYICEFVIKQVGESQGHWLDSAAHRTSLLGVRLVEDGPDVKTVRLTWDTVRFDGPAVSDVSIFPDSMVLKIDYLEAGFPHICDLGKPGGVGDPGTYIIYGAREWQQARKSITDPELREHPNEHHRLTDDLYPIYPNPLIDKPWGPSPMSYKGWYIMGVYREENGRGFGRVVPADVMTYIKLLWGKGLEFFPHWRGEWKPYTTYLFAVTEGADEILSVGRQIADEAGDRFAPVAENMDAGS